MPAAAARAAASRSPKTPADAAEIARKMLGMTLVTHQTGPEGRVVQRVLIEETLPIERELYLGIVLDRARHSRSSWPPPRAAWTSKKWRPRRRNSILKEVIDPAVGFPPFQARKLAFGIGLRAAICLRPAARHDRPCYAPIEAIDASLVEINPFLLTEDGKLYALDAKINLDDNAFTGTRICWSCATSTKRIRSRSKPPATGSTTSSSTARSAAWSTAPAWPWPPWTSSSTPAEVPPIFSTSAAGASAEQVQQRVPDPARGSEREGGSDQHLRRHRALRHRGERGGRGRQRLDIKIPIVVRLEGTNVEEGRRILRGLRVEVHGCERHEGRRGEGREHWRR